MRWIPSVGFFLVGAGLQVSGFEDVRVAVVCFVVAAVFLMIAVASWDPVRTRVPFLRGLSRHEQGPSTRLPGQDDAPVIRAGNRAAIDIDELDATGYAGPHLGDDARVRGRRWRFKESASKASRGRSMTGGQREPAPLEDSAERGGDDP
jgi:hypothetical protein